MAILTQAFDTEFTPATGYFIVTVTGGSAMLERKNASGAPFAPVGPIDSASVDVNNTVAGAIYRFTRMFGANLTVRADQ